mgnify:CR=1 FL=1
MINGKTKFVYIPFPNLFLKKLEMLVSFLCLEMNGSLKIDNLSFMEIKSVLKKSNKEVGSLFKILFFKTYLFLITFSFGQ